METIKMKQFKKKKHNIIDAIKILLFICYGRVKKDEGWKRRDYHSRNSDGIPLEERSGLTKETW